MLMIFLFIISLIFPISDFISDHSIFLSDFSSIFVFQLFFIYFFISLSIFLVPPPLCLYFQSFCSFSLSFPSQSLPHRSFSVQVCYRHGRHVLTLLCFACSFLLCEYIFFYIPPLTSHPSSSSQPHRLFGPPSLRGGDWPCLQLKNTRSHVPLPLIAMSVRRYSSAVHTGMPDLLASFALWKCSVFSDYLTAIIFPNRLPDYSFLPPHLYFFKACVWFMHAVLVFAFKIIQNGCTTSKAALCSGRELQILILCINDFIFS